jgi:predicted dehydrogenase
MKHTSTRRQFLRTTGAATAASVFGFPSIARAADAAKQINVAVIGVNSRGGALAGNFSSLPGVNITHICDVDSRAIGKCVGKLKNEKPKGERDFRKVLENKDVDAVVIATPDHWHAPMTMLAMDAGKHVYVEKPCSHNPAEGEMLIKKQKDTGMVFQMGNQRRSSAGIKEAKALIEAGEIGDIKKAECWYGRKRGPIGTGKVVEVPDWLDWELWQGPAPHTDYRDNIVHYNWHWFLRWGTGEVCNNGTHEIDVCRWLLGVDYPTKVASKAGREVITTGDWEFFDHQVTDMTFANGMTIRWEGYSHKSFKKHGKSRGTLITGSKGEMIVTEGGYEILGREKKKIDTKGLAKDATDTTAPTKELTGRHCWNFIETVRGNAKANSPVDEAHQSVLLCHLANIAQFAGGSIDCDPKTGRIVGDAKAMEMWGRDYQEGWEPKV